MSEYDLIPEEAYENLPQDANDQFAVLVRVAQTNLARLLDTSSSNDFSSEIRSQFISIISGIAEALGIEGLPRVDSNLADYDKYQMFQVYLAGVVARVRLQGHVVKKPYSVELGRVTRARIQQEIDQLRYFIDQSDLSEKKKSALKDKLDELEEELAKKRLSFARTMAITAAIMASLGGGTTALAKGPEAKETLLSIIRWIGEDKEKEEEERLRLAPPPKALPDLTTSAVRPQPAFDSDLDDDVPF
jgi:molybdopterin converting factor small subunit